MSHKSSVIILINTVYSFGIEIIWVLSRRRAKYQPGPDRRLLPLLPANQQISLILEFYNLTATFDFYEVLKINIKSVS